MNDEAKWAPAGDPSGGEDTARELERALANPEQAQNVRLRLEVDGGAHGERYNLWFDSAGDGTTRLSLMDEMTDRRFDADTVKLPSDSIRKLFNQVDVGAMVAYAQTHAPIPPCSLVGRLEIVNGDRILSTVFMADEEQAKTAGFRLPPRIQQVVDSIYDLAARQMGTENIRP